MSSSVYTKTAIQIINRALRLIRVIDPDTSIEPRERENGIDALNGFIKYLQTEGFNLWRETEAVIPLVQGQKSYSLGNNQDRAFDESEFIHTTLSLAAIATDTTLNLVSTAGISGAAHLLTFDPTETTTNWTATAATLTATSAGLVIENSTAASGSASYDIATTVGTTYILTFDYTELSSISLEHTILDAGGDITSGITSSSGTVSVEFTARQTTTTVSFANTSTVIFEQSQISELQYIDKSAGDQVGIFLDDGSLFWSTVVTVSPFVIANELTGPAAMGNVVYSYQNAIPRPLDILQVRYLDNLNANETPTTKWSRDRYFDQPDKDSTGTVTTWYYSPQLGSGSLYVWQPTSQLNSLIKMTYIRPLLVVDNNTDTLDFPAEWFDLLSFGTAYRLMAEYTAPEKAAIMVATQYSEILESALGFDNDGDVNIQIDYQGRQ